MPDQTVRMTASHMTAIAPGMLKSRRIIPIICVTVFSLPPFEAAITTPSEAATMRSPETMNSREIITTTIHAGKRCSSTSAVSTAMTSILSASGSMNFPRFVTMLRLRAM